MMEVTVAGGAASSRDEIASWLVRMEVEVAAVEARMEVVGLDLDLGLGLGLGLGLRVASHRW